jgi:hypothetical protein
VTLTYADKYHQTQLHARINDERMARSEQLATGLAASMEDYRERIGYLTALRDVLGWSDDIAASANREMRKPAA